MKATKLTEPAIKRIASAPPGQRIDRADLLAPGLFLRVNDRGRKTWYVHFRCNGVQGKIQLGAWPGLGLKEARQQAHATRDLARKGTHPAVARAKEKAEEQRATERANAEAFSAVARLYVEAAKAGRLLRRKKKRPLTPETVKARESRLNKWVLPVLGGRPIKQITREEVAALLDTVQGRNGPVDRVLELIRAVFEYAEAIKGITFNGPPPTNLAKRQPSTERDRVMTDEELRVLWLATGQYGYPFGHCVRLVMLTGQRRGEWAGASLDELDLTRRMLVIPAARCKNRAGFHEVPLSDAALTVVQDALKVREALGLEGDFLFTTTGEAAISGWSKVLPRLDREMRIMMTGLTEPELEALRRKGPMPTAMADLKRAVNAKLDAVKLPAWGNHTMRHTLVTRMGDGEENAEGEIVFSIALDVVQAVMNYSPRAKEGVTNRYDHGERQRRYRLKKREALNWWARKLMGIVEPGAEDAKVVPLRA